MGESRTAESVSVDTKATPVTPPVVMTRSKVSLADHLNLRDLPLGTTPGGRNFTMKALHPSDHEIKSARVPGGNRLSVALCCDMVTTIPVANAGSRVTIFVTPNILQPANCTVEEYSTGTITHKGAFMNAAFGGSYKDNPTNADWANFMPVFKDIEAYRVTAQSATVELIAPALSDQGTIVAVQFPSNPRTSSTVHFQSDSGYEHVQCQPDVHVYERAPDITKTILGTSAYTAKAREGVYMPLKLNKFKWVHMNDPAEVFVTQADLADRFTVDCHSTDTLTFPIMVDRTACATFAACKAFPKMSSYNFGVISMDGVSAGTSVRIRVRQVVEIMAPIGSVYSPLVEVALPPDDTAMRMYFEISQRCADGYPASYNDLGKLKDIILNIGKRVLPFVDPALNMLSAMPGIPGAIGKVGTIVKAAAPAVIGAGKQVAQVVRETKAARKAKRKASKGKGK